MLGLSWINWLGPIYHKGPYKREAGGQVGEENVMTGAES